MSFETMNIYSTSGTKVRYKNRNGYDGDREFLKENGIYTVDYTEVGGFHTSVYLREVPERSFNSVMFEEVKEGEIIC